MKNYTVHIHNVLITVGQVAEDPVAWRVPQDMGEDSSAALCHLLATALRPACIYRVEHRAPESGCRETYINLVILMADPDYRPLSVHEPLLQLAELGPGHIQCFIHRLHTVNDWIRKGHPFYCRHLTRSNLAFSSGRHPLPDVRSALSQELLAVHRKVFDVCHAKAADFYKSALMLRSAPGEGRALTAFMLHQALELGFRGILEALNGYCRKTHEIRQLRALCFRCAPQLGEVFPDDTEEERELLDVVQAAYSGARYNSAYAVSEALLDALIGRVDCFLQTARLVFARETELL